MPLINLRDVLKTGGQIAGLAGAGITGYGQDKADAIKESLQALQEQRAAKKAALDEMVTRKALGKTEPGEAGYGQYQAGVISDTSAATAAAEAAKARALIPVKVNEQNALIPGKVAEQNALLPGEVAKAAGVAGAVAPITLDTHKKEHLFDNNNPAPDKPQISVQQPLNPGEPAQAVVINARDPQHPQVSTVAIPGVSKGANGASGGPQMAAAKANFESALKTMDEYEAKLRAGTANYGPLDATKGALGSSEKAQNASGVLGAVESLTDNLAGSSLRDNNAELANYLKAKKFLAEAALNTHKRPNQTQYEIEQELSGVGPRLDGFTSDDAARQIAQSKERRDRFAADVFGIGGGGQPKQPPVSAGRSVVVNGKTFILPP